MMTSHGSPTTIGPVNARFAAVETMTIERMTGSPRTTRIPSTREVRTDGARPAPSGSVAASAGSAVAPGSAVRHGVRAPGVAPERTNQSATAATANDSRIDGECRADPDQRDGDPGDRRTDGPDQLRGPLHEGVGRRQAVGRHESRDERVDRRQEDGIDRPEHDAGEREVPDLDLCARAPARRRSS